MTAVLQLVPPSSDDDADPRSPEVYRGGLASARAALREGVSRRHRHADRARSDEGGDGPEDHDA